MHVGQRVQNLIDDRDMTQTGLAKQLHIPVPTLNGYISGRRQFPSDILKGIAELLAVTTDFLLGVTEIPEKPLILTKTEQNLIENYRTLAREQKELIVQNIRIMREQNGR